MFFRTLPSCHLILLPPYHLTTLPPYHLTTWPPYHLITLPPYHLTTLPPYHLTTLSPYHLITLPPYHLITLSLYHLITLSPYHLIALNVTVSFRPPSVLIRSFIALNSGGWLYIYVHGYRSSCARSKVHETWARMGLHTLGQVVMREAEDMMYSDVLWHAVTSHKGVFWMRCDMRWHLTKGAVLPWRSSMSVGLH